MDLKYIRAENLDEAWRNFEYDLPLEMKTNQPNPFYVNRPGDPAEQLEDALLAPFYRPPIRFFSGHRGCGKSTELRRIAVMPEILQKYYPIHFTIQNEADIEELDYKDVLLALGRQMYNQYKNAGGKLRGELEKELERWRGKIVQEYIQSSRLAGFEVEAGIDLLGFKLGERMKLEPRTRNFVRQVIEPNIRDLIENVINQIADEIRIQTGRTPLVLIDDLDKPDFEIAQKIFFGRRTTMLEPLCAIVYTISSSLYYSSDYAAIKGQADFLPNIRLHPKGKKTRDRAGYATLREFVHKRMNPDLISTEALNEAIRISGGVVGEMARVMRAATRRARRVGHIEIEHVHAVEGELRSAYRRIIREKKWLELLVKVHRTNRLEDLDAEESKIVTTLLQMLAILEYNGRDNWWDVHPVLEPVVEEYESSHSS